MKNAINTLLLCTCSLLLVDAGIVSNRETIVQVDVSQPPSVVQPQSETVVAPVTPEIENVTNKPVKTTHDELDGKPTWVLRNLYSVETDDDDDEVTFETVSNITPEYWINSEPSADTPVYKDFVSSESDDGDSDYESDSIRNVYNLPPPLNAHSIPGSYSFDSEPDFYRSLLGEIRYKLDAIVRRQALILKYIKCSCPDADKCRSPHLQKLKAASWSDMDDLTPKQFSFPGFSAYNHFTPPFFSGTPYNELLSALTTLKSAIEKVTVRQNIIYQYTVCSCNKTNECSKQIKPVLDSLFGVDFDLLSPLFPYGSSTFNQFGFGSPEGLFGLGGGELSNFNKPNVTSFGNGPVSGSVFSGTIGESSHPSGAYYGTYVSSSSGDRQPPGSGVVSSVQTSCVGNAPCETSGSLGISTDGKKPQVIQLPFSERNVTVGTNVKPLGSLENAIEELNSAASGISVSLEGNRPTNSAFGTITSDLVASLSETSHLASDLLNRITSDLKPNRTSDDSSSTII